MNHIYLATIIIIGTTFIINLRKKSFEEAVGSTCVIAIFIGGTGALISILQLIATEIAPLIGIPAPGLIERLLSYSTKFSASLPFVLAAMNLQDWAEQKLKLLPRKETKKPLAKAIAWTTIAIAILTLT